MGMLLRRHRVKAASGFTGQVGTAVFENGEAVTDDPAVVAFAEKAEGFTVEPVTDADGGKLTPKQALIAELAALGLPTEGKADELRARLEDHAKAVASQGDTPEAPTEPEPAPEPEPIEGAGDAE